LSISRSARSSGLPIIFNLCLVLGIYLVPKNTVAHPRRYCLGIIYMGRSRCSREAHNLKVGFRLVPELIN
jgi:hypothetical protein